jgi:hypothetical protein
MHRRSAPAAISTAAANLPFFEIALVFVSLHYVAILIKNPNRAVIDELEDSALLN